MKDVHTEHCCKKHGCKYGEIHCLVAQGLEIQSGPCEECRSESSSAIHVNAVHFCEQKKLKQKTQINLTRLFAKMFATFEALPDKERDLALQMLDIANDKSNEVDEESRDMAIHTLWDLIFNQNELSIDLADLKEFGLPEKAPLKPPRLADANYDNLLSLRISQNVCALIRNDTSNIAEMAVASKVDSAFIHRICFMKNYIPSRDILGRIAKAYGRTIKDLEG